MGSHLCQKALRHESEWAMRKWIVLAGLALLVIALGQPLGADAASPQAASNGVPTTSYFKATVVKITDEGVRVIGEEQVPFRSIVLNRKGGSPSDEITVEEQGTPQGWPHSVSQGDTVVMSATPRGDGSMQYSISDTYRLNTLIGIVVAFSVLVVIVAGRKGVGALAGICLSLLVILKFVVPGIINGHDPLLISVVGGGVMLLLTTYLAHGVSRQTTVALASTYAALGITVALSHLFVAIAHLTGAGGEDAAALQFGSTTTIDLQGLLLAGIIIGTLGALNDVTTTQAATIFELGAANPSFDMKELARRGFLIGREHIVSLVNTIVLAYAGVSLIVFIFLNLNPSGAPLWVLLNSELIAEEVVRTVASSFGLILAVPIATLISAWLVTRQIATANAPQTPAE
jgi:uncharacterized membrane protein